jgi:hypothetical protein
MIFFGISSLQRVVYAADPAPVRRGQQRQTLARRRRRVQQIGEVSRDDDRVAGCRRIERRLDLGEVARDVPRALRVRRLGGERHADQRERAPVPNRTAS